jgi:hypothetical protein
MTSNTIREGWTVVVLQSSGLIALVASLVGLGTSFLLIKMHRSQTEASASEAVSNTSLDSHHSKKY